MKIFKLSKKSPRIMVFQGSPRYHLNCPSQDSKTQYIVEYATKIDGIEFDICDLSLRKDKPIIQPCKGCQSIANGYHCHWPCDCYVKNDKKTTDLIYDENIYDRIQKADGFVVFSPIHWYSVSSQIKALFDRLVCANLTITHEQAVKLKCIKKDIECTDSNIKNNELTEYLERSGKYDKLLKNHLEGKYAAFFVHGDDGALDYNGKELPKSMENMKENTEPKLSIIPIVQQCRYSGIFVPEDLIIAKYMNKGISYSEANVVYKDNKEVLESAKNLVKRLAQYIKG